MNIDPSGNFDLAVAVASFVVLEVVSALSFASPVNAGEARGDFDHQISLNIARVARGYVGSEDWLDMPGRNQCNIFVYDVLREVGHAPPKMFASRRSILGFRFTLNYPPLARQWADPNFHIPFWGVVAGGPDRAKPGDIIAERINYSDATGHIGIVVGLAETASAASNANPPGTITISDYGFRDASDPRVYGKKSNAVVRRFTTE